MKRPMKFLAESVVAALLILMLGAGTAQAQLNAYVANGGNNTLSVINTRPPIR